VCVTPPDHFPVFTNTWPFYIQTMRPSTPLQPELEWSEPHLTSSMPGTAPQPVDIYNFTTTCPLASPMGSLCSQALRGSGIPFTVHQSNHAVLQPMSQSPCRIWRLIPSTIFIGRTKGPPTHHRVRTCSPPSPLCFCVSFSSCSLFLD
jgi:hypothetical protein